MPDGLDDAYVPEEYEMGYDTVEEAFRAGVKKGIEEGRALEAAEGWRKSVEKQIDDMSWVHNDPTGQDADSPKYTRLFDELIEARDYELKHKDPERYAEMKHFEAAARYFP